MPRPASTDYTVVIATLVAGAMIAQQVGGKAARDAFFLSHFDVSALPTMMMVSALVSIVAVRVVMGRRPASLVPWGFTASGLLLLAEWVFATSQPRIVATALYLHIAVFGSVLISGFWSLVTERLDPYTARRRMGRIATGASVGAVAGGLLVERVGAVLSITAVFPLLAALHLVAALLVLRLRPSRSAETAAASEESVGLREGLEVFKRQPYLRHLAYLVLVGAVSAALIDYAFKAEVAGALGEGEAMVRFFALFYIATGVVTLVIQALASGRSLERLGLAGTASSLPAAVVVGGLGMILLPGLAPAAVARALEATTRSSLFRSAYELFYTPVSRRDKRATKTAIDVLWERLGDAAGGAAAKGLLLLGPVVARSAILAVAAVLGGVALWLCRRLHRGYVEALEASLLEKRDENGGEGLAVEPSQLHSILFSVEGGLGTLPDAAVTLLAVDAETPGIDDELCRKLLTLRTASAARIRSVLAAEALDPLLVPQVVLLLGRDEVARDAARALEPLVDRIAGQLGDALIDPGSDFAVRRRIARLLARGSERAVTSLVSGLEDERFEVRYRCGRGLGRLQARKIEIGLTRKDVFARVGAEIERDRWVLESVAQPDPADRSTDEPADSFDELLRKRAHRRLAHLRNLLALVLPREPIFVAFRALEVADEHLRGTALEYLDSVLPVDVRQSLWPFLTREPEKRPSPRSREEIVEDLMSSSLSLELPRNADDRDD